MFGLRYIQILWRCPTAWLRLHFSCASLPSDNRTAASAASGSMLHAGAGVICVARLVICWVFVIWQIFEEQECCLLLKWGPEQIVTFQHPYLVLLPYSIRPCGLLTLWWPARLLPWRLPFPSLSSERSGPDSGSRSRSGGDWLWPEQRNTARTVSKHCIHVNFPGVRMCKSLVFRAAVYRWDQWDLFPSWNVKVNVSLSIISDVLLCGGGNLKWSGYK